MAPRKSVFFIVCLSARSGNKRTSEYARSTNIVFFFLDAHTRLNDYDDYDDYGSLNQLSIRPELNVDQSGQFS